jgi:hypothetical protein
MSDCRSLKALITPGQSAELIRSGADIPESEIVNFPFPFSNETKDSLSGWAFINTRG